VKDVSAVGLPLYTLAKYAGMERSPGALRRAGLLSELGGAVHDEGDAQIPGLEKDVVEGGMKNLRHFKSASRDVFEKVSRIPKTDRVVCIGGECSFTVGALAGLRRTYKGKPGMLWMDAHGDFNTPETSESGYIGGMCLAIACGRGPKFGDEIEDRRPLLEEERLVHVGSRALDPLEREAMRGSPMGLFTMKNVNLTGTAEVASQAARRLSDSSDWIVYHLDVDVVDPSIVPAVNYPTAGGMTIAQVVHFIRALDMTGKLKVLEIASYNADLDRDGSCSKAIVSIARDTFR